MFDMFSRQLRVIDGKLWGVRWFRRCPIEVEEIEDVRVYGWNNPFLEIRAGGRVYRVGAIYREYEEVVRFLEDSGRFDVSDSPVNRYNLFLFRRDVKGMLRKLASVIRRFTGGVCK